MQEISKGKILVYAQPRPFNLPKVLTDKGQEAPNLPLSPGSPLHLVLGTAGHELIETGNMEALNRFIDQLGRELIPQKDLAVIRANFIEGCRHLKQMVEDSLPEGNHYFHTETNFVKNPNNVEMIIRRLRNPALISLAKSGYDDIPSMVKTLLLSPDAVVSIRGTSYSLSEMVRLVNFANNQKRSRQNSAQPGFDSILEPTNILPNKNTLKLMELLIGLSTYEYFSQHGDSPYAQSFIAAAAARSDMIAFTADPGSEADTFLKQNIRDLFHTDMLDLQYLEKTAPIYSTLVNYILNGKIKFSLIELKMCVQSRVMTDKGPDIVPFKTDPQEVDLQFGSQMAHTTQSIIQSLFGIFRLTDPNNFSSLFRLNSISSDPDKASVLKKALPFILKLYEQQFLLARLHFPIIDSTKSPSVNSSAARIRPRPHIAEIDPRTGIRHRLSRMRQTLLAET